MSTNNAEDNSVTYEMNVLHRLAVHAARRRDWRTTRDFLNYNLRVTKNAVYLVVRGFSKIDGQAKRCEILL